MPDVIAERPDIEPGLDPVVRDPEMKLDLLDKINDLEPVTQPRRFVEGGEAVPVRDVFEGELDNIKNYVGDEMFDAMVSELEIQELRDTLDRWDALSEEDFSSHEDLGSLLDELGISLEKYEQSLSDLYEKTDDKKLDRVLGRQEQIIDIVKDLVVNKLGTHAVGQNEIKLNKSLVSFSNILNAREVEYSITRDNLEAHYKKNEGKLDRYVGKVRDDINKLNNKNNAELVDGPLKKLGSTIKSWMKEQHRSEVNSTKTLELTESIVEMLDELDDDIFDQLTPEAQPNIYELLMVTSYTLSRDIKWGIVNGLYT